MGAFSHDTGGPGNVNKTLLLCTADARTHTPRPLFSRWLALRALSGYSLYTHTCTPRGSPFSPSRRLTLPPLAHSRFSPSRHICAPRTRIGLTTATTTPVVVAPTPRRLPRRHGRQSPAGKQRYTYARLWALFFLYFRTRAYWQIGRVWSRRRWRGRASDIIYARAHDKQTCARGSSKLKTSLTPHPARTGLGGRGW